MGLSRDDRDGLDKSLKDLNLSHDELDKFSKAFKDPEFLKLFEEYAKEVSDPKVKAETDMYLRQLEMEGRVEEVYGKGAQLILPVPAFVVKTQNTADGQKVFINVCTSEKLGKASLKSAVDASGRKGSSLDLPLCLGPKKAGVDQKGNPCCVWDFVVHPEALEMAAGKPAIKKSIIEMAIEKIEDANQGVTLHRGYKEPKLSYKGTEDCPQPHALAMRGPGSEAVSGRVKPTAAASAGSSPAAAGAATAATSGAAAAAAADAAAAASSEAVAGGAEGARSKFAFPTPKQATKQAAKPAPLEPTSPGYVHATGEVTPSWEVVDRGQIDLTEAWGDAGRNMAINTTHPKELVIRIKLPGVASASAAELDVSRTDVSVLVPGKYRLVAPLRYPVNSDMGRAKFDKSKQQLEVVVPVLPPTLPPPRMAPSPVQQLSSGPQGADLEDGLEAQGAGEGLPEGAAADLEAGEAAAAAAKADPIGKEVQGEWQAEAQAAQGEGQAEERQGAMPAAAAAGESAAGLGAGDVAAGEGLTENQRRWLELHKAEAEAEAATSSSGSDRGGVEDAASGANCTAAAESVEGAGEAFTPAPAFQGARPGCIFRLGPQGLGYYRDVPPVRTAVRPAQAPAGTASGARPSAAPAVPKLQPRLNSALVADLD